MIREAAWLLDEKRDATRAACLAKNFADERALMVTDRAVQTLGGLGYMIVIRIGGTAGAEGWAGAVERDEESPAAARWSFIARDSSPRSTPTGVAPASNDRVSRLLSDHE